ncbi:MAG: SUMF1/EgtB/PvdO family nonheme iron enzyme, partial [Myxococcales bacterium]|nr:SUMF1/EgtB/PvdO family nonheme iron enzyme [Myxococcales bacterium]
GNVWEWTDSAEAGQRILRGGGWMDSLRDQLRADARILVLPTLASLQFGIRCARDRRPQPGD